MVRRVVGKAGGQRRQLLHALRGTDEAAELPVERQRARTVPDAATGDRVEGGGQLSTVRGRRQRMIAAVECESAGMVIPVLLGVASDEAGPTAGFSSPG